MLRLLLALWLITGSAAAQGSPLAFNVTQECGSPEVMFQSSLEYGEQPLWGGETLVFGTDQNPYWGTAFFTVNQDNGFWTLFTFYSDNFVCVTASGVGFVAGM